MLCKDFDLGSLVYESRFQANAYFGRNFVARLQELGVPLDEFLSAIAIHLDEVEADSQAIVHLERASEILRSQQSLQQIRK